MLTRQLASFVIGARVSDIPAQVLLLARDALIDTLGCSLAGTLEAVSEIALRWAQEAGARLQAAVPAAGAVNNSPSPQPA